MTTRAIRNFHLPLPDELHAMLRDEAAQSGIPATALVRDLLAGWLKQRRRERLFAEIQAYAIAHAGTDVDLDDGLQAASMEVLAEEPWPDDEDFT